MQSNGTSANLHLLVQYLQAVSPNKEDTNNITGNIYFLIFIKIIVLKILSWDS